MAESNPTTRQDVLDLMAQDAGMPLTLVHADGGAVHNSFLVQFIADMIRISVRASSLPELSALGAVFAGALGMNVYSSLADLETLPQPFTDFEPKLDAALAAAYYSDWQAAVQRVL
jgi:glycerol kinase